MDKMKQLLGEDHPNTLTAMENLAKTYRCLGHEEDAEELEALVMNKRNVALVS